MQNTQPFLEKGKNKRCLRFGSKEQFLLRSLREQVGSFFKNMFLANSNEMIQLPDVYNNTVCSSIHLAKIKHVFEKKARERTQK